MNKVIFFISIILLFICSSCATIFNGRHQYIQVYSNPSGALIYVNGVTTNEYTPCRISIKRRIKAGPENKKNEIHLKLKKDGYSDAELFKHNSISWLTYLDGTWNNLWGIAFLASAAGDPASYVFGVPLIASLPLDYYTGAMYKFPSDFHLDLNPLVNYAPQVKSTYEFRHKSDVDNDIPEIGNSNQTRFALIIGNEDYTSQQIELVSEANVDFARNDACAFKEYATKALGIPKENITFILDGTTGKMKQALDKMGLLAKNSFGDAEIFFYYAGHGLPDEINKEPYLIPVDVNGNNVTDGLKLMDVYEKLTKYPCKRITVFLDACFSGGARSQGLFTARGIKVKPKEDLLKGNLVVFSASSGEQSSLAYKEKEHGLFTYFLLQKFKESKCNITYKELSDYITQQIGLKSVLINNKEQNPQTNVSPDIQEQWQNWKFISH